MTTGPTEAAAPAQQPVAGFGPSKLPPVKQGTRTGALFIS